MGVVITTPTSNGYGLLWWHRMFSCNMWHDTLTTNCDDIYLDVISMIISHSYICDCGYSMEFYICLMIHKSDYNIMLHNAMKFLINHLNIFQTIQLFLLNLDHLQQFHKGTSIFVVFQQKNSSNSLFSCFQLLTSTLSVSSLITASQGFCAMGSLLQSVSNLQSSVHHNSSQIKNFNYLNYV